MLTKTTVQQNIPKTMCLILQNTSYLFRRRFAEDDFTLVLVIQEKQRIPTLSSHQIVNELNPAKIEIRDKALKVAMDSCVKTMPLKFSL
jgi:hypothetical protein